MLTRIAATAAQFPAHIRVQDLSTFVLMIVESHPENVIHHPPDAHLVHLRPDEAQTLADALNRAADITTGTPPLPPPATNHRNRVRRSLTDLANILDHLPYENWSDPNKRPSLISGLSAWPTVLRRIARDLYHDATQTRSKK